MTIVASGSSQTITATVRGETVIVTTNGGVLATVTQAGSTSATRHLGPLPRRVTFGPMEIGDTLLISADTGDVAFEYGTATPGNSGGAAPGSGGTGGLSSINGKTGTGGAVTLTAGDIAAFGLPTPWLADHLGGTPRLTSGTAVLGTSFIHTGSTLVTFDTMIDGIPSVGPGDVLSALQANKYTLTPASEILGPFASGAAIEAAYPSATTPNAAFAWVGAAAPYALWFNSQSGWAAVGGGISVPHTTALKKGDGAGGLVDAVPGVDYRPAALIQSGVTLILPPSGSTIGANGAAFTAAIAFDQTYANGYMKLNANEIASGQAAGWYYVEMSSTTAGIVYNNTYTPGSGIPTIPGSKTAFTTNAGGTTAGTVASTQALAATLAADSLGANGVIRYTAVARWNNSAGTKKALPYLGASFGAFPQIQGTTSIGGSGAMLIANAGVKNKQWNYPESQGAVTTAMGTLAIDTTASQTVAINLQTVTATDWVALVMGRIEAMPAA